MAWLIISLQVINNQQFGTLLLQSFINLIICLIHDVKEALFNGYKASLLIIDVKGAFDIVLISKLAYKLHEQS
jgi:hypothetical protein